jgi:hypothetical protein
MNVAESRNIISVLVSKLHYRYRKYGLLSVFRLNFNAYARPYGVMMEFLKIGPKNQECDHNFVGIEIQAEPSQQ